MIFFGNMEDSAVIPWKVLAIKVEQVKLNIFIVYAFAPEMNFFLIFRIGFFFFFF